MEVVEFVSARERASVRSKFFSTTAFERLVLTQVLLAQMKQTPED